MNKFKEALDGINCGMLDTADIAPYLPAIREALSKAEKYCWHDLRKNPEDLPSGKESDQVYVAWCGSSHLWYDTMFFYTYPRPYFSLDDIRHSIINTPKFGNEGQIVAWRYIEPFEEEENNG